MSEISHQRFPKKKGRTFVLLPFLFGILFSLNSCHSTGKGEPLNLIWIEETPLPSPCEYCLAVAEGNNLYALSGDERGTFQELNDETNSWRTLSPLPLPRTFPGGDVLQGNIYVAGGIDSNRNYTARVDCYSIAEKKWLTVAPLSRPRSRLTLVSLGGKLYAIGGLEGSSDKEYKNSSLVEEYDPELDQWVERSPMPTPRHGLSATAIGGKIIVAGGYCDSGITIVVEEYDPASDSWRERSSMPTGRGFFGLVHLNEHILAIGGRVPGEGGPIEAYHPIENRWQILSPLPTNINRFGIASLKGTIYVVGGEESPRGVLRGNIKE